MESRQQARCDILFVSSVQILPPRRRCTTADRPRSTSFNLNLPRGYDIPLSFVFGNSSQPVPAYRCQLFVNGYQFGKHVSNLGPQTSFPVPEGVLDYHGQNWIALTVWAPEAQGVVFEGLTLESTAVIQSGYGLSLIHI